MQKIKSSTGAEIADPIALGAPPAAAPQAKTGAKLRIGIYARYSTDGQKETSIDDQIRTCEETAKRQGLPVAGITVFADEAITGAAKATHKREQYHALREAVRAGLLDIIICDQQCRLARSARESLTFFDELKEHRVRLLTGDGFDSEHPTSQLLFGIKSVFSEFFLDETRHRVRRGMIGEFERGSMVSAIPFGYQIDVARSASENRCVWAIQPEQAEVVKEIFRMHKDGMSLTQVAAVLNSRKIPPPLSWKKEKESKHKYWRQTATWRIIQNPIYKGLYQVNFRGNKVSERQFDQRLMPELALVSPEDWNACQKEGKKHHVSIDATLSKSGNAPGQKNTYGGGKHPLSGVLRCGVCGSTLSCHKAKTDNGSMHCIQCEHATNVGVPGRQPHYVSIKGVRQMLGWLLGKVISGEAIERYRQALRERLAGGRENELAIAKQELAKTERSQARLGRLLHEIADDDPVLEQQYIKAREDTLHFLQKVQDLEEGMRQIDAESIQKQLDIDLSTVVEAFLSDSETPGRTRALLNRVFPSIVLVGKTDRFTAIFKVEAKPGAILAEASGTAEMLGSNQVIWVRLQTSGPKFPVWTAEEIEAPESLQGAALENETS